MQRLNGVLKIPVILNSANFESYVLSCSNPTTLTYTSTTNSTTPPTITEAAPDSKSLVVPIDLCFFWIGLVLRHFCSCTCVR